MADGDSESELLARELDHVGSKILALETRVVEVETVIKRLEASLATAEVRGRHPENIDAYTKYLASELRRALGYEGCPLVLVPRPRPKTIETRRTSAGRRKKRSGARTE